MRMAIAASMTTARQIITRIAKLPNHEFWADDIDCLCVPDKGIIGHKQVTDAYLATLAAAHRCMLATMDKALAAIHTSAHLI